MTKSELEELVIELLNSLNYDIIAEPTFYTLHPDLFDYKDEIEKLWRESE